MLSGPEIGLTSAQPFTLGQTGLTSWHWIGDPLRLAVLVPFRRFPAVFAPQIAPTLPLFDPNRLGIDYIMTLRKGHGSGAGVPRIEVLPADELPAGVPAPAEPAASRDASGRFVRGPGASEAARRAAKARHQQRALARLMGLRELPEGHPFAPYRRLGSDWRDAHMAQLAATVAGGEVGPGPASMVASAALQLSHSRYLADLASESGDPALMASASRLADASRQNLLAAHELAAKEAAARPPDHSATRAALLAEFGARD